MKSPRSARADHSPSLRQPLGRKYEASAREIVEKSMRIAGKICIYTNENIIIEELG